MICPNCGATVEDNLPECPYCGTINYPGAEKEYLNELNDIKDDLDDLNEVPAATVKKELKHVASRTGKRVFTCLIVILLIAGYSFCKNAYEEHKSVKNSKLLMEWQLEALPKLDAMYEAGDFEGICEFLDAAYLENNAYHANNWKHMSMIYAYEYHRDLMEPEFEELDSMQIYSAVALIFFEPYGPKLTQEEQARLESYQKDAAAYLYETKGFTEEEVENIHKTGELP